MRREAEPQGCGHEPRTAGATGSWKGRGRVHPSGLQREQAPPHLPSRGRQTRAAFAETTNTAVFSPQVEGLLCRELWGRVTERSGVDVRGRRRISGGQLRGQEMLTLLLAMMALF